MVDTSGNSSDYFVAVCSPTQIEDFQVNEPAPNSSYFRVSEIDLIGTSVEYVEDTLKEVLYEVRKLIKDTNQLNNLDGGSTITVT